MADIAAAVVGLRETTYKEHQRLVGGMDELRATVSSLRTALDETVDKRLAASAQGLRDLERRLQSEHDRRLEAILTTVMDVVERLTALSDGAVASDDPTELQQRLASLEAPRDKLRRILDEAGVRPFAAEGEPYDPLRHEVVRREFVPACRHEYVLAELKPGYVREGIDQIGRAHV